MIWCGVIAFAWQIYCDFSGYSDIAIGSARVMGYELMENFNRPYFSTSIAEFWRRWHISLSSWFRDYLYIPLGGNRVSRWRWYYNLIVVFMICGLWHGAKWTFVLWGALHGFYMIASISTGNLRKTISDFFRLSEFPRVHRLLKIFVTFHLVLFGWVFFRANTISDAFLIIKNAFLVDLSNIAINVPSFHFNILDYLIAFLSIILMESIHLIQTRIPIGRFVSQQPTWLRWSTYYVAMCAIVFFGAFQHSDFIYFQF